MIEFTTIVGENDGKKNVINKSESMIQGRNNRSSQGSYYRRWSRVKYQGMECIIGKACKGRAGRMVVKRMDKNSAEYSTGYDT